MQNVTINRAQATIDICWNLLLLFAVIIGANMLPDAAHAAGAGTNAVEAAMCNVVALLTSTTGKAIATLAVIVVGIGALLGKISWGMALIVALGIALVFGAATIVNAVSGNASAATCAGNQNVTGGGR